MGRLCLRKAPVRWRERTSLLLGLSSASLSLPHSSTLPHLPPASVPRALCPSLSLLPGTPVSPCLPLPDAVSACPYLLCPIPTLPTCPIFSPNTPIHVIALNSCFSSNPIPYVCPHCPLSRRPHLPFISPLCPSFQSRNGQVYLWGDTRLGPHRPACPFLATPDGPAHRSPRPAGHALCHLPLQLHRPQARTLLGSTTCLPRATAGLGGLHCQDGSGQWEQES